MATLTQTRVEAPEAGRAEQGRRFGIGIVIAAAGFIAALVVGMAVAWQGSDARIAPPGPGSDALKRMHADAAGETVSHPGEAMRRFHEDALQGNEVTGEPDALRRYHEDALQGTPGGSDQSEALKRYHQDADG